MHFRQLLSCVLKAPQPALATSGVLPITTRAYGATIPVHLRCMILSPSSKNDKNKTAKTRVRIAEWSIEIPGQYLCWRFGSLHHIPHGLSRIQMKHEVQLAVSKSNTNKDGRPSLDEFVHMLKSKPWSVLAPPEEVDGSLTAVSSEALLCGE